MSYSNWYKPYKSKPRKDKYNKKLLKYKVEIEDGESELSEDEENCTHQDTEAISIFSILPLPHVQVNDMSDCACPRFLPSWSHSLPQVAEEDVVHKRLGFEKVAEGSDEDSENEENAKQINTAQKDGFKQHCLGLVLIQNWRI